MTSLGITCVFTTNNTHFGTLTGSATPGSKATLDIDSASIPRTGGSVFCGSSGELTGGYQITTPTEFAVDASAPDLDGHFVTGKNPVKLIGTEIGSDKLEWTIDGFAGGIVCDKPKWESGQAIETRFTMIFEPTLQECHTTGASEKFEITMHECGFVFFVAEKTTDTTEQTASLHCGKGNPIEIMHPKCTAKIPTQKLQGITYTKINLNEKHALTFDFGVVLDMETVGACGEGKRQGMLEGSLTVEAVDALSKGPADITAT